MDISVTDISDVQKQIEVHASADELAPHFEKAYRQRLPDIEIKGFRKGRVPLDIVKKIRGDAIEHESLDTIVNDVYRQIVEERKIRPIGDPVLTTMDYKRGEALTFKITYEIKPDFTLQEYKGLEVEKIVHSVTDAEIDDEITRLRRANSTLSEADVAADQEHIITCDIQETDASGNPLIGRKKTGAKLHLADQTIQPELREALIGASTGAVKRVSFEAEGNGEKHASHLQITITKIEKVTIPSLDEAFVKKITREKVETVEALRKAVREDLEADWQNRSERQLGDALIGEIVRRHDFTVPESFVRSILDSFVEDLKNRNPSKRLPVDFDEERFRTANRAYAVFQAKWILIQERIIEAEKIHAEQSDLERLADAEAPRLSIDKDRLMKYYESSDSVTHRIVSDKLMAVLKSNARIKERISEEFRAVPSIIET